MTSYIGQIKLFAFNFVPKDWFPCDGSVLFIQDFEPLFSYIGRSYSEMTLPGSQFKLPDLRGVVPLHRGRGVAPGMTNNYVLGKTTGSAYYHMKPENLPQHSHAAVTPVNVLPLCSTHAPDTSSPVNAYPAATPGKDTYAATMTGGSCVVPLTSENVNVEPAGAGEEFSLLQPSIGLRYCICHTGIFPAQPD